MKEFALCHLREASGKRCHAGCHWAGPWELTQRLHCPSITGWPWSVAAAVECGISDTMPGSPTASAGAALQSVPLNRPPSHALAQETSDSPSAATRPRCNWVAYASRLSVLLTRPGPSPHLPVPCDQRLRERSIQLALFAEGYFLTSFAAPLSTSQLSTLCCSHPPVAHGLLSPSLLTRKLPGHCSIVRFASLQ
jgi:hypothetical protein